MKQAGWAAAAVAVFVFAGCMAGNDSRPADIPVQWVDHIDGDFSFSEKWRYSEWIFRNQYGQLICDGWCPPETEAMRDASGRIIEDSLAAYYRLVDTTHYYYTMTTDDPQLADTLWYLHVNRLNRDTVVCITQWGVSTCQTMQMLIVGNRCRPVIEFISPALGDDCLYPCTGGSLLVDSALWRQGIMKAVYRFDFCDSINRQTFTRQGKCHARIENNH